MGWQIPAQIEQDIISGKAQYRTFQTGSGGQSILPVPTNAYAVIFGYDFSPAGGGFQNLGNSFTINDAAGVKTLSNLRVFETQQISFYTGQDYYPFIHHVNLDVQPVLNVTTLVASPIESIDTTPICRQVYITSSNDVTITHGLILSTPVATQGAIPQTNRTPGRLTYGGSGQAINVQTDFGPAANPNQYIQPSPKDFEAYGLGLLPNAVTDQAWASPDSVRGLVSADVVLTAFGASFRDAAAANYFLCLHYALYTSTIPEQRG